MLSTNFEVNWIAPLGFYLLVTAVQGSNSNFKWTGRCFGRAINKYPVKDCNRYLKCPEDGRAIIEVCDSEPFFNWITRTCEELQNSSVCNANNSVDFMEWSNLTKDQQTSLSNGKKLQMPPYKHEKMDKLEQFRTNIPSPNGALFRTYFLAAADGPHKFSSNCTDWCKLWITKDACEQRELVLHQKNRRSLSPVEYVRNNMVNLTFGSFYLLQAVVVTNRNYSRNFQIGVWWNESKENQGSFTTIPGELLRLNTSLPSNCSKLPTTIRSSMTNIYVTPTRSSTFHFVSTGSSYSSEIQTTFGLGFSPTSGQSSAGKGFSSSITSSTARLHSTESLTSSSSVTPTGGWSSTQEHSRTQLTSVSPTTTPTPTQLPDSDLEDLAVNVSEFLGAVNETADACVEKIKQVDTRGHEIAKKWDERGKSLNISLSNVVMEVNFPIGSYIFPRSMFYNKCCSDQIFIPARVLADTSGEFERRMFSVLYSNLNEKFPKFFNEVVTEKKNYLRGDYKLNSHVLASTAVPNIRGLRNYDIVINLAHLDTNITAETKLLCVFYKWKNADSGHGVWSTEGCIRDETMSSRNMSVCRCNHLTHFAILVQVEKQEISKSDAQALTLISYIGCALSLIGVSLTVLAIACLPGARSDRNFIHVNLAVAIGSAQVIFLAGIDKTENKDICTVVAALLHYFLLAAFSWMLIEGIFLHILIVKVFHDQLPKKRFYFVFCWGLPAVIVLLSACLLRDGYGTETSCWLSTDKLTIWTFSGPAIMVITINIIILCKVMKEISSLRTSRTRLFSISTIRDGIRSTIILLPLLGLTWALGLICVNGSPVTFQYLFAIFNSLQGLFIFLFHCVLNSEVRKAFWRKVDLWFTTHSNPFVSNGHSRSSFKKSKDDQNSCSPNKDERSTAHRNGISDNSVNEELQTDERKLSSITASSYVDSWAPKLSVDDENGLKGYAGRFCPTLTGINDMKYQPRRLCHEDIKLDLKERFAGDSEQTRSSEDLSDKTRSLEDMHLFQKQSNGNDGVDVQKNSTRLSTEDRKTTRLNKRNSGTRFIGTDISVGIGGQRMSLVRKLSSNCSSSLNKKGDTGNVRKISVRDKNDSNTHRNRDSANYGSKIQEHRVGKSSTETKL